MYPYVRLFGFTLPSYGVMLVIAGAVFLSAVLLRTKLKGYSADEMFCLLSMALVGGILGAKLLYILTALPEIIKNQGALFAQPKLLLNMLAGGFVFYGGILGAFFAVWLYGRKTDMPLAAYGDLCAPFIPLAHAIGRVGCFFAGCCYGRPAALPFGMYFSKNIAGAPTDMPLLPVQLYEAGINLVLMAILLWYSRKTESKRQSGSVLALYAALYAVCRFILEFLRFDSLRGIFFGLSTSQWISLAVLLFAGRYLVRAMRFSKAATK